MSNYTISPAIVLADDDTTAAALVSTLRDEVRLAINAGPKYAAYVEAHSVTTENVSAHGKALAAFVFPHLADDPTTEVVAGKRTRTRWGHAINAATAGLRRALPIVEDAEPKAITLRATLSGEGGGSTVIDLDSALGQSIIALIRSAN